MARDGMATLAPDSDTLTPLPSALYRGLAAVAFFASFSLASTTTVFFYLTYKFARWHIRLGRAVPGNEEVASRQESPHWGLQEQSLDPGISQSRYQTSRLQNHTAKPRVPNQYLVLVYNLLLADMHQSMAFLLNAVWVGKNGIWVDDHMCFVQGWFISTGNLASSCFISIIALHTYFAVIWDYKFPQWFFNTAMVLTWSFVYIMAISGIAGTHNGERFGGYYVRASTWCWVNIAYENLRLVLHYLWIFMALAMTSFIYIMIFFALRRRQKGEKTHLEHNASAGRIGENIGDGGKTRRSSQASLGLSIDNPAGSQSGARHPAFLIYPLIYVICTAPLALGRIATMAGVTVPLSYFCVAGALITSNGWLDVTLWSITRRELIYNAEVDKEDVGLDTFTFMRTPPEREFGNIIWVEGAAPRPAGLADAMAAGHSHERWGLGSQRSWLGFGSASAGGHKRTPSSLFDRRGGARSVSDESSRRGSEPYGSMAIQLETVTSVDVELDPDTTRVTSRAQDYMYNRHRRPSTHSGSEVGSEKDHRSCDA